MKPKKMQPILNPNKTINELMGNRFKPTANASYLITKCEQLCNVPISELTTEDYRILINQEIGLEYIAAPAIDILSNNLFAEGDYFEGDLLKSVLTIDKSFWKNHPLLKEKLKQSCLQQFDTIETLGLSDSIKESLRDLVKAFLSIDDMTE